MYHFATDKGFAPILIVLFGPEWWLMLVSHLQDWTGKAKHYMMILKHSKVILIIFQGPLAEVDQAAKINYLIFWMGTEAEHVILNTHQPSDMDMVDTYFDYYIRPVSRFKVSRHQFYQQKTMARWAHWQILLAPQDILRECRFPDQIWDEMLLDWVIYAANHHEELVKKFLSKGEDLMINLALEMKWSREVMDQSYKDIKQGVQPSQVEAMAKWFSKACLKGDATVVGGPHQGQEAMPSSSQVPSVWQ